MRVRQLPGYRERKPADKTTEKPLHSVERIPTSATGWLVVTHTCGHKEAHSSNGDIAVLTRMYTAIPCTFCMQTVTCSVCKHEVQRADAKSLRIAVSRMVKQPTTNDLQPEEFASTELWVCAAHAYVLFRHMQHTVSDLQAQYAPVPTEAAK